MTWDVSCVVEIGMLYVLILEPRIAEYLRFKTDCEVTLGETKVM